MTNKYLRSTVDMTLNNLHNLSQPTIRLKPGTLLRADNPYAVEHPEYFEPASDDDLRNELARKAGLPNSTETAKPVSATEHRRVTDSSRKEPTSSDQARRRLDELEARGDLPAYAAERVERLLTAGTDPSRSLATRWVLEAGSEAYTSAFLRMLRDPQFGSTEFSNEERDAWRKVQDLKRSMVIGTDTAGGFMVPTFLDPAILLTNDGSNNPLRQIARVEQITTTKWSGVSSAGVDSDWYAESAEVTDDTPELAQPEVEVHRGTSFVPYSFEFGNDSDGGVKEIARLLRDGADRLQSTAFTTGSGSGQPYGAIHATEGATGVNTGGAFDVATVYALQEALPPRWQNRARFVGSLPVINKIAAFETTNGHLQFPEVREDRLLRKPLHENSDMTSDTTTTNARFFAYGDWSEFLIVDRIGSTLELVPHLFGENGRPKGERGALLWFRTGSRVLVQEALRVLVKTT